MKAEKTYYENALVSQKRASEADEEAGSAAADNVPAADDQGGLRNRKHLAPKNRLQLDDGVLAELPPPSKVCCI